jgi:DNA-binding response OmpR family regulator
MTGKKVLIADDDPKILDILEKKLRQNNYEVIGFSKGKDVIDKCKIFNPDLLILDIIMQDIDGYSVARLIRQDQDFENIPIIFITAQELEYSLIQKKLSEIDHCDFINKSCTFKELLAKIKEKIG